MEQLSIFGKTKTEMAINFIREHEPEEGYFVGFSGGKDSIVVLDLVQRAGVKHRAYYSATGIDPPELVKFINEHYPYVIQKRPLFRLPRKYPDWKGTRSFYGMILVKGFPTRTQRWCCDKLKKDPTKDAPFSHRILGLRAEESAMRAKRKNREYIKYLKQWVYKPIFSWLEWEIWDYIESRKLPYPSLYDEGFSRLGCVVCPFICHGFKGQLKINMDRWPKHYAAFEKAMKKVFDNYLCVINPRSGGWNYRNETDFQEFITNWYHGVSNKKDR